MDSANWLAHIQTAAKSRGLKMTPQRLEIFRALMSCEGHPDADTVLQTVRKQMPTISADTVYRTLASLFELGLINRLGPPGDRVRFDANPVRHHHFVCTSCGEVRDFHDERFDALTIPSELSSWGDVSNFNVEVRGRCFSCLAATQQHTHKEAV